MKAAVKALKTGNKIYKMHTTFDTFSKILLTV